MARTSLTTTFREKDTVKALGAKWDADERKWYVPAGLELAPFSQWLPAGTSVAQRLPETITEIDTGLLEDAFSGKRSGSRGSLLPGGPRGKTLSQLMQAVSGSVSHTFPRAEWVLVEVIQVRQKTHYYLEGSERDPDGSVLASARAMIWAKTAEQIMPPFFQATGMVIGPNMKLLVQAKPTVHPVHGLSLVIEGIDPDYSLGDLEARKREVRSRLQAEGMWGANKALPRPWDFNEVLVISPLDAAGLGDFRADADRLAAAGLCRFTYASARFQGEGAGADIVTATTRALKSFTQRTGGLPDALVVIRGGGAVSDLAWLNDYELTRFVCSLEIPVLCGIGHERDNTLVDEVSHTRFDTPSKVVYGIASVIKANAQRAQAFYKEIAATASRVAKTTTARIERDQGDVRTGATRRLALARNRSQSSIEDLRREAVKSIAAASNLAHENMTTVRAQAATQLALAKERTPRHLEIIRSQALGQIMRAQERADLARSSVLEVVRQETQHASSDTENLMKRCGQDAKRVVVSARLGTQSLMREVAGQGPAKTLERGFALVRNREGVPITSAESVKPGAGITLTFHDGQVAATIEKERKGSKT